MVRDVPRFVEVDEISNDIRSQHQYNSAHDSRAVLSLTALHLCVCAFVSPYSRANVNLRVSTNAVWGMVRFAHPAFVAKYMPGQQTVKGMTYWKDNRRRGEMGVQTHQGGQDGLC